MVLFLLHEMLPHVMLKSLRLGSVISQVPVPIVPRKLLFKAMKLLIHIIQKAPVNRPLQARIFSELVGLLKGESA